MFENIKPKKITGKKIRTNNSKINEIVSLWKEVPNMELSGNLYAVYFNYESDYKGDFDFLIGSDQNLLNDFVDIKEGKYMIWTVKSNSPEDVGAVWNEIWNTDLNRSYKTDFEVYSQDGSIKIYIGVE